jgi:hypothetical protein
MEEQQQQHQQHYIFGYGSLICRRSRAVTLGSESSHQIAIPVLLDGWQVRWSTRVPYGMTALGIISKPQTLAASASSSSSSSALGVLVPVTMDELVQLDIREGEEYHRTRVSLRSVHTVPFLGDEDYQSQVDTGDGGDGVDGADHYRAIWQARQAELDSVTTTTHGNIDPQISVTVWVYEQVVPECPGPSHPIVQSYLDIILQGCLDISLDFATGFLQRVQGWSSLLPPRRREHDPDTGKEQDAHIIAVHATTAVAIKQPDSLGRDCYFVNDRRAPIYIRSDSDWSHGQAEALDALIQAHQPAAMMQRTLVTVEPNQPV